MIEIANKFLLAGHKVMAEMHLKQTGFIYSACGSFTKNKEKIQKFKETVDTNYIYKNELDKACFQHDLAYGDFKDLAGKTVSDKNLENEAKYDKYQRGLASMVYTFFDKTSAGSSDNMQANKSGFSNEKLVEELHKTIIRKF